MSDNDLQQQFAALDGERTNLLRKVRECARLTIPQLMPDPARNARQSTNSDRTFTPDNYQGDCQRFVTGFAGRLLEGVFPPGVPYAARKLSPEILDDPTVPAEWKITLLEELALRNMIIISMVESSPWFYARKFNVFKNLLVCGECAERMNDDYSITLFKLDNYVTLRDSTGTVLSQIFRERLDLASLEPMELELIGMSPERLRSLRASQRVVTKYTRNEWNPWSKTWVQTPGIMWDNKCHYLPQQEDRVSAFWTTPWDLTEGENYAIGLCELNFGDITTIDTLAHGALNFADITSWMRIGIDEASDIDENELLDENGRIIRCRVDGGAIQNVAMMQANKMGDWSVFKSIQDAVTQKLGRAFLSETAAVRDSERTTLGEITATTIRELQNATNGAFATIATHQQMPMFLRAEAQLVSDRKIKPIPRKMEGRAVKTVPLTGLAALAAQTKFQNIMRIAELAERLQATEDIDKGVFLNAAVRYFQVDEPGLVLSAEKKRAMMDEAMARQAQARAIDAAGTIAENAAANQTQGASSA